jgi:membrane-associated phospholipid phosphatase
MKQVAEPAKRKSEEIKVSGGPVIPPQVRGGPVLPPKARGGPVIPPRLRGGPVIPPRQRTDLSAKSPIALVAAYQANAGVGAMLHATDRLDYTTFVKASRKADRAVVTAALKKHASEVEALSAMDDAQRMLLARTPLLQGIRVGVSAGKKKASLTVGKKAIDVVYPAAQSKAALDQVVRELPMGEINIPYIVAEAENPVWAFVHALGLHRTVPSEAFGFTGQVLDIVNDVVVVPVYTLKHVLQVPRPVTARPDLPTWIPTPGHTSFPSGHATFAHAAAVVLNALVGPKDTTQLAQLAAAVAKRRELAGLHTHLDSATGRELGLALGAYLVEQATRSTAPDMAPWRALFAMAANEWVEVVA